MANLSADTSYPLDCVLTGAPAEKRVTGELLTGAIGDYNDFENGEKVTPVKAENITVTEAGFQYEMAPCSVAHFAVKPAAKSNV